MKIFTKTVKPILSFKGLSLQRILPTAFTARLMMMVVLCLGVGKSWGQLSITSTGTAFTQNFDGMGATGTTTPTNWFVGTASAAAGTTVVAGTGSSATGQNYNFGVAGVNAVGERALGSLCSGSTIRNTEARFINNTGSSIASITISYDGEQWRLGQTASNETGLVLNYSIDGITYTAMGATYNFAPPITTGTAGPLDGNVTANRIAGIGGTYTPAAPIANGATFYLRWVDIDNTGSDAASAVDNFSITATAASSSATLANITQPSGSITQGNTDVVLSGFKITPAVSIDFTAVTVSGSGTATSTDISNVRIFRDNNADGIINGADASVSVSALAYSASMGFTISGETGFSTVRNYLIVADVAGVGVSTVGNTVTASVASGAFTTTAITNTGSATGNSRTIVAPPGTTTVSAGSGTEPATISSLINTQGAASLNFDITILDDGATPATDGVATQISQMIFNQGTGNTVANWTLAIAGAELNDGTNTMTGTVNSTNITFSSITNTIGTLGYIGDDASKTYTLKVWLNSDMTTLKNTIDNLRLVFRIQTADVTVSGAGSQLAAAQDQNSGATNNTITVASTALAYVQDATNVLVNAIMLPSVKIGAVDANGNRDLDFVSQVRVTSTGTLTGSPVDVAAIAGLATFGTLTHTVTGTGLTLNAELTATLDWDITSVTFNVTIPPNYYSQISGDPAVLTNWNTIRAGGGSSPAAFTDGNFVIQNAHNMSTTAAWAVGASGTKLQIESGGTLTAGHAVTVASTAIFQIDNGGKYTQNAAVTMGSSIFAGTEVFAPNSTVEITVNPSGTSIPTSPGYGNLILNVTTGAGNFGWSSNISSVQGNFTVLGTGTGATRHALIGTGTLVVNIGGDLTVSGGNFWLSSSTGTCTINLTGNLVVNGGTLDLANSSGVGTINLGGNLTVSSGTLTEGGTTTTSKIVFNKIGTQTITGGGTISNLVNMEVSAGSLANLGSNVTIPGSLSLNTGNLVIGSNTLTLGGAVTGTGTLTGSSASNLVIGGAAGTLNFTTGSQSLKNLTLNSGATATLGTPLDITAGAAAGVVTVASAATLTTGGNLTLKSDANGTARVANSAGTITGNVTVERYISNIGRKWRLLSGKTIGSTQTIFDSWQEGGAAVNNLGTWITKPGGGSGFDGSSNNPGLLRHDPSTPSWIGVTATNTGSITDEQGYMLFVRGDRNDLPSNATNSATVLRTTGTLNQGIQPGITIPNANPGYSIIGNPYASPIDFEAISGTTNLSQFFYVWDASYAGTYGVGGFRLVQRTGPNTYTATPTTGSDNTLGFIHSGQAFFVKTDGVGDASLVLDENSKASSLSVVNPIVAGSGDQQIYTSLVVMNSGGTENLADAFRVRFSDAYLAATTDDAPKIGNFTENISSYRNNKKLIVELRPMIAQTDTIFLFMSNMTANNYRFKVSAIDFVQPGVKAWLQDTYTGKNTLLDLAGNNLDIDFSVTSDPASADNSRFRIVFAAAPQPQTQISLTAAAQGNAIAVEWKAGNQYNMKQYELERSTDGISYTRVNTQAATGTNGSTVMYNWLDANPVIGSLQQPVYNFYRIRSVDMSASAKITDPVLVKMGRGAAAITVYPNPVTGNRISLKFTGMEKGVYLVRLYNNMGQLAFTQAVNHAGGTGTQALGLGNGIAKGNYQLEIVKPDNSKMLQTIMITE